MISTLEHMLQRFYGQPFNIQAFKRTTKNKVYKVIKTMISVTKIKWNLQKIRENKEEERYSHIMGPPKGGILL